jgi:hypothetical protein
MVTNLKPKTPDEILNEAFTIFFSKRGKILFDAFQKNLASYHPPQRRGTPQGELIGFGLPKILAAILRALGCNPKVVFEYLGPFGGKYGVIKKWATEEGFQKLVEDFRNEVKANFLQEFLEISKTNDSVLLEGNKPGVERIFGKAEYYGPELSRQITEIIIERLNQEKSLPLLHTTAEVLSIFYDGFESDPLQKQAGKDLEDYVSIHLLCRILHAIQKDPAILNRFPEKAKFLLDMFDRFISLWAIKTNLPMNLLDRLIDSNEWIGDNLQFVERVDLLWSGQESRESRVIKRKIFLKQQAQSIIQDEIEDLKNELFQLQGKKKNLDE